MARQARIKSNSGIYHVMIRGINKEKIFINELYKIKLLDIIKEIKKEINFSIIAYCIMDNHLHLLIKDTSSVSRRYVPRFRFKMLIYLII